MLYMCGVNKPRLMSLGSGDISEKSCLILKSEAFVSAMGVGQAMKRIPRIKFPKRHQNSSGSAFDTQASSSASGANLSFFSSSNASATMGGKASLQPKRTPVSNEEIEAILLGGSF